LQPPGIYTFDADGTTVQDGTAVLYTMRFRSR
jgi:hypothetical protein